MRRIQQSDARCTRAERRGKTPGVASPPGLARLPSSARDLDAAIDTVRPVRPRNRFGIPGGEAAAPARKPRTAGNSNERRFGHHQPGTSSPTHGGSVGREQIKNREARGRSSAAAVTPGELTGNAGLTCTQQSHCPASAAATANSPLGRAAISAIATSAAQLTGPRGEWPTEAVGATTTTATTAVRGGVSAVATAPEVDAQHTRCPCGGAGSPEVPSDSAGRTAASTATTAAEQDAKARGLTRDVGRASESEAGLPVLVDEPTAIAATALLRWNQGLSQCGRHGA